MLFFFYSLQNLRSPVYSLRERKNISSLYITPHLRKASLLLYFSLFLCVFFSSFESCAFGCLASGSCKSEPFFLFSLVPLVSYLLSAKHNSRAYWRVGGIVNQGCIPSIGDLAFLQLSPFGYFLFFLPHYYLIKL